MSTALELAGALAVGIGAISSGSGLLTPRVGQRRIAPFQSPGQGYPNTRARVSYNRRVAMAGGRSFSARKFSGKRRRPMRSANIGRLAYQKVKRIENTIEKKALFVREGPVPLPGSGTKIVRFVTKSLAVTGFGAQPNQRIGNDISPRMLTLNICLTNLDAQPHCVRVILFQCKNQDPRDYTESAAAGSDNDFLEPKGQIYKFEYTTLYDNIVSLSAGTTNNFPIMVRAAKMRKICNNGTQIVSGDVFLMFIRDNGAGTVNARYISKLTYTDA